MSKVLNVAVSLYEVSLAVEIAYERGRALARIERNRAAHDERDAALERLDAKHGTYELRARNGMLLPPSYAAVVPCCKLPPLSNAVATTGVATVRPGK